MRHVVYSSRVNLTSKPEKFNSLPRLARAAAFLSIESSLCSQLGELAGTGEGFDCFGDLGVVFGHDLLGGIYAIRGHYDVVAEAELYKRGLGS